VSPFATIEGVMHDIRLISITRDGWGRELWMSHSGLSGAAGLPARGSRALGQTLPAGAVDGEASLT